jgi:iron-sulfur cluster repair protein YtfE (RIC family)
VNTRASELLEENRALREKATRAEALEKRNQELAGEISQVDALDKILDRYRAINKELMANAKKVDDVHQEPAKEHEQVLKELSNLKTQLVEFENARAEMDDL